MSATSSSRRRWARCSSGTTSISTRRSRRSSRRCSSPRATTPRRCSRRSPPTPPASWCGRSAPSCSAASATWSAASTRSSSPSSSWAPRPSRSALLPTYDTIGIAAPILLIVLRLLQGLALGGEYGGAATYVAEHAPDGTRGYATSWIQTTATLGFFLSLLVIGLCRSTLHEEAFQGWGWRVPFLVSLVLLLVSRVYIRLRLDESPVFLRMKAEGKRVEQAPAARQLPALSEQQARAARAVRRRRPARASSGTRASSTRCSSSHHAQARLPDGVHAGRRRRC